jgi:hypothetical protein
VAQPKVRKEKLLAFLNMVDVKRGGKEVFTLYFLTSLPDLSIRKSVLQMTPTCPHQPIRIAQIHLKFFRDFITF